MFTSFSMMQAKDKMTTNFPATGPAHHEAIKDQQRQRSELKDDYDHENVEIEYVIENVLFERQEQEQHHHQHQHMQPSSDTIEYVEYESLSDAYNSFLLNSCSCAMTTMTNNTSSSSSTSSSVESGTSGESACGTYATCPHGGNYISSRTELVLNPERHSKDLIYECSVSCKCDPASCDNRLVQFGPRVGLEIIASKLLHKQYALRTNAPIPRGAFICEYAGELLTRTEAQRRMKDYERRRRRVEHGGVVDVSEPMDCNKMNYVLCLNEYSLDGENASTSTSTSTSSATTRTKSLQQTFVDPRLRGNIGRYLNHSCQPNCEILSVRVDCPIPKIAIFAKRDIQAGEELCFHYGNGGGGGLNVDRGGVGVGGGGVHQSKNDANAMQVNKSTPCLCGSNNCENFLPNLEF
ncbi:probable histone-lysine N-methyltransferase set-23 [Eupeodes corollae]|uniref:probable histone-lysine N-methyltransferase set-23 n=1 Tax=Eupeodes corollae TaxID=290404 RepID=UPI0024906451|nr:probable histone-lysine N-methyltransferase set-23 [Eupeodes corollae]